MVVDAEVVFVRGACVSSIIGEINRRRKIAVKRLIVGRYSVLGLPGVAMKGINGWEWFRSAMAISEFASGSEQMLLEYLLAAAQANIEFPRWLRKSIFLSFYYSDTSV
jgi:hypothetical protein